MMNTSTGFKKRVLRPASGLLNKEKEFLRSVDISQSQLLTSATLRGELANIQEEINLLDKDRAIRHGESTLQRPYILACRKELRDLQRISDKEDDDAKVLKQMGVDSFEAGFRKLWRLAGLIDTMIVKITELQMVQFVRYDQMYCEIGKDSGRAASLLSSIANGGYHYASFPITQILMSRGRDMFEIGRKETTNNGNSTNTTHANHHELITVLQSENAKLSALIEELQLKSVKHIEQNKTADLQLKYTSEISKLRMEKHECQERLNDISAKLSICETKLKIAEDSIESEIESKPVARSGSYEQALLEEMEKMKKGFERKINTLTEELTAKDKETRRKEGEAKAETEKLRWQKSLLLKKFESLTVK